MFRSTLRGGLAMIVLATIVATLHAQGGTSGKRRYVQFKIDPDFENILKNRLRMEEKLGPFKDLVKKLIADPSKLPKSVKDFEGMKIEDDEFKQALKDWLETDQDLRKSLTEMVNKGVDEKQPPEVKKKLEDLKQMLNDAPPVEGGAGNTSQEGSGAISPESDDAPPESLAAMVERTMKRIGNTRFGDILRDSPAWRRALTDVRESINNPDAVRWREWQSSLKKREGAWWQFGEGTLGQLGDLPRPAIENWDLPGVPKGALPSLTSPGLPDLSGPSLPSLGAAAGWIVLFTAVVLVLWQLSRWKRQERSADDSRASLGPWPVRPESVASRAELILAFDYLALWTLGLSASSWNHRAVAQQWRKAAKRESNCAAAAQALEDLYEQARYTDGAEALTEAERDLARRSLLQLVEGL